MQLTLSDGLLSRTAAAVLPLALLAALALLAVTIRSEVGPSPLAAATPTPDAALKQQCIEGAAVGSGNDGLASDCALLLAGKDTLRGTATLNWSASLAIASWEGVTVSGTPGRVTQLHIDGWNSESQLGREIILSGTIPSELGGLSKLERVILPRNRLTGSIPAELGLLPEITVIELYGNRLTGAIPPELGGLARLSVLYISGNRLSGAIPVELGELSRLVTLWLHNNRLTGRHPRVARRHGVPRAAQARGQQWAHGLHPGLAAQDRDQRPGEAEPLVLHDDDHALADHLGDG